MLVSFLFHVASGQRRPLGAWGDPDWVLGILKTFLVFLFGNNVTSRFGQAEAPSDGRDNDPSPKISVLSNECVG